MYLSRELTDATLPAIGRAFGGRNHTTVLHAVPARPPSASPSDPRRYDAVHRPHRASCATASMTDRRA